MTDRIGLVTALKLHQQRQFAAAEQAYRKHLSTHPSSAEALFYYGNLLQDCARYSEAIEVFRRSLAISPNSAAVRNNLASVLRATGEVAEAISNFREAIRLDPNRAEAHSNLGGLLHEMGDFEAAESSLRRALDISPTLSQAKGSLGLCQLLKGRFKEGWQLYEERLLLTERYRNRLFPLPLYEGNAGFGERVFIHCEQGFGDSIQFIRYAKLIAAGGAKAVVGARPELKRLLSTAAGVEQVLVPGDPVPSCACQVLMMSLPRVFGTTIETIPSQQRYLSFDEGAALKWAERIGASVPADRKRVGLVWAGAAHNKHDRNRSLLLSAFDVLQSIPNLCWFSLQKGGESRQISNSPLNLVDFTHELEDFADTAALIETLDLVITVDTAVAHLAAALGKPTWILIHYSPDWRWLLHRDDSPWYPSVRLFRQPHPGDWEGAMARVRQALVEFAGQVVR